MKKPSADFLSGLRSFILPDAKVEVRELSNNTILQELVDCFDYSCRKESVGSSLLFNMHFLIILHPDTFEERSRSFPVIAKEAVKAFYKKLETYQKRYEEVSPVSFNWFFRFGPGAECQGQPIERDGLKVIGMLNGLKTGSASQSDRQHTTRVTMKSKATNLFDSMDLNMDVLNNIHFAESGSFQIKFNPDLKPGSTSVQEKKSAKTVNHAFASIRHFHGTGNGEVLYTMKDAEIVIARKESENLSYGNYLLIDSPFVSNPHARIRYSEADGKFQIASFSRNETRVNEALITRSEPANPLWVDLPAKCQLLINSMVTLEFTAIR